MTVEIAIDGRGVATLALARPAKRNAMDRPTINAVRDAARVDRDLDRHDPAPVRIPCAIAAARRTQSRSSPVSWPSDSSLSTSASVARFPAAPGA